MKTTKRWRTATLAALLGSTALTLMHGTAQATNVAPACGDTLGPGGNYTLIADVGPCAAGTALIVQGPVTVDLNGHTVSCTLLNFAGIEIQGVGAFVTNGTVAECEFGVHVVGTGEHHVSEVTARDNPQGFVIESNNNHLDDNTAAGTSRTIPRHHGFWIRPAAARNTLTHNRASDNDFAGFQDDGERNRLSRNRATGNYTGFIIGDTAHHPTLARNRAINNTNVGFEVVGDHSTLKRNTATQNDAGIQVGSDAANTIQQNTATGNTSLDLWELTPGCGTNVWQNNVFGTANEACIQ
jgi:parallel beta-helix repeat protein